jgi:hypothetical protein
MNPNRKQKNKTSIYIQNTELTKLEYYQHLYKQINNTEITASAVVKILMNNKDTLDSLIARLIKRTENEQE